MDVEINEQIKVDFVLTPYQYAMKFGRLSILAQMTKHTGAGMALGALVKSSGVKI